MNYHRERAQRKEREAARAMKERPVRARALAPKGSGEDSYPDPPGNDEFDSFDESFQLRCVAKFERGIRLTLRGNARAKEEAAAMNQLWLAQDKRRKAEARRVAQLHLDRLTREQRDYRKRRSEILDSARRRVRT